MPSPSCYQPSDDGKVYFFGRGCVPSFRDCSYTSDSYSEQMKQFWWYTKDRYLCNEYMNNMYFGDIADPDLNPKCLILLDQHLRFAQPQNGHTPQQIVISKKSTERFKIILHGVTGPYGDVCLQSTSGGSTIDQGRRRLAKEAFVRGYEGGEWRLSVQQWMPMMLCAFRSYHSMPKWMPNCWPMPYGRGEEASNQLYRVLLAACSSISLFCSVPCADAAKGMYCVMCLDVNLMLLLQLGWEVRCESMDQVRKLARDVNDQEEFVRYLNQVALPVQKPVLERWGFEATETGVTEMRKAIQDHTMGDDAKLKRQAQATTRALYGEMYNAVRGEALRRCNGGCVERTPILMTRPKARMTRRGFTPIGDLANPRRCSVKTCCVRYSAR
eukprot:s1227_g2.t1